MKEVGLIVVGISDAFSELWQQLGDELGAGVRVVSGDDGWAPGSEVAAVIVAAGGREHDAVSWLEAHPPEAKTPHLVVGVDTGHRISAQLVNAGARDYLALPADIEILRNSLSTAVRQRGEALERAARVHREPLEDPFAEIIGASQALRKALDRAARVIPHGDTTILITGETGTGKELLARAIHKSGPRAGTPFVPVNCTALPAQLLESEIFGHERGAFTGAHASKPGLFEIASGGTLLLDEIGHMSLDLQSKLLRVLEDKRVRRVGGTTWSEVDVRIIAATNEDLDQAVREGTFRQDLYYRLGVITLSLPPLRERADDAGVIAEVLIERLATQLDLPVPKLGDEVKRALLAYHWPGNVRELKNAVERALVLSPPSQLQVGELLDRRNHNSRSRGPIPFPASLTDINTAAANAMLELCHGNQSEASRRLNISRGRFARLLGAVSYRD